jgi:hypothetical protein
MAQKIKIILDLSDKIQTFLEQQNVNLYEELQQAEPSLQLRVERDPDTPQGSRDLTTIILATASLATSLTPLIIRILNQYIPPNQSAHWEVEETETHQPDGTVIIQHKRIRVQDEQRPWITPPPSTSDTTKNQQ